VSGVFVDIVYKKKAIFVASFSLPMASKPTTLTAKLSASRR
jgi:hypothetical protein